MIYYVRSGTVEWLAFRDVMEMGKEAIQFYRRKYPEYHVEFVVSRAGRAGRIAYVFRFESLAAYEEAMKRLSSDPEGKTGNKKWAEKERASGKSFWVDGMQDEFWEIVEP